MFRRFKKMLVVSAVLTFVLMAAKVVLAYDFGDFKSVTLTTKAWGALNQGDTEAVLAYTNKCLELYGETAKKMQESLTDYPNESKDKIFSYWALNDVATSLFIQGEAFRKAKKLDEAKTAYSIVVNDYSFGQAWDTRGWFWKPAEAAKEKIAMIESGSTLDFGDYSSSFLTKQAWQSLHNDKDAVTAYVDKIVAMYETKAKEMQASLTELPSQSKEKIFSYWALNDVGTALFIKGQSLQDSGDIEGAQKAYKKLVDEFSFAQCYDPSWDGFWQPAKKAQEELDTLGKI